MSVYITLLLWTLTALLVKHWLFDFVWQTEEEIRYKGTYGHPIGIQHSFKHAVGTGLIFAVCGWSLQTSIILAMADGIVHYHIDWVKVKYGTRDVKSKSFWVQFGFDQLLHQLTYLAILVVAVRTV